VKVTGVFIPDLPDGYGTKEKPKDRNYLTTNKRVKSLLLFLPHQSHIPPTPAPS
jgi:hypothetical protein